MLVNLYNLYSANIEINKVRKQKEIDLAGLQAGLKKAQSRINSLEQEVQQKVYNYFVFLRKYCQKKPRHRLMIVNCLWKK